MSSPMRNPSSGPSRFRPVRLGPSDVVVERRPDGILHLRSPHALGPYPAKLTERLEYWAARAPDRVLFAQRDETGGWRSVTYAEALDKARRIGEALLRRSSRRNGPSPSCRATTSSTRCWRWLRCMSASPTCRSRPPTRWSRRTSASCGTCSICSRRALCSPPTAAPSSAPSRRSRIRSWK